MDTLFSVTAPARSGTKWFSDLFTTDRSFCYHELTTDLHPYPSNRAPKNRWGEQVCSGKVQHAFSRQGGLSGRASMRIHA